MGLAAAVPEVAPFEGCCAEERDGWFAFALREADRMLAYVVALVDSVERSGSFHDDGHSSPAAWVKAVGNTSTGYAKELVAMARVLRAMPTLAEEFVDGSVGSCQLRELIKLHRTKSLRDQVEEYEQVMLANAKSMCFDDFVDICGHFRAVVDPDGTQRSHERAHDARNVTAGIVGEEFVMNAHAGSGDGATMMKVLDAFTRTEFEADMAELRERCGENAPTVLLRRTHGQRRADALRTIFETAAAAGDVVAPGEAIVGYVIDDATWKREIGRLLDPAAGAGAGTSSAMSDDEMADRLRNFRCETDTGVPVDPRIVIAAALNGRVRRIVTDPRGIPVDVGRVRRFFDGPLRDALQALFRRCLHPGCDIPAHQCQIDHLTEYTAEAGPTAAANAGPLCGRHNRWKHDHQQSVWLDPGGQWHIYRHNGTEITPRYNTLEPDPPR